MESLDEQEKKPLEVIAFPPDILERLKFMCQAEELGMSAISTDVFAIIIVGRAELPANYIHLVVAQSIISGILTGQWLEVNEELLKQQDEESKRRSN